MLGQRSSSLPPPGTAQGSPAPDCHRRKTSRTAVAQRASSHDRLERRQLHGHNTPRRTRSSGSQTRALRDSSSARRWGNWTLATMGRSSILRYSLENLNFLAIHVAGSGGCGLREKRKIHFWRACRLSPSGVATDRRGVRWATELIGGGRAADGARSGCEPGPSDTVRCGDFAQPPVGAECRGRRCTEG